MYVFGNPQSTHQHPAAGDYEDIFLYLAVTSSKRVDRSIVCNEKNLLSTLKIKGMHRIATILQLRM